MVFVLGSVAKAYALAGDLKSPSLAFPTDMAEGLRTRIVEALNDRSARFLEGRFVNANTTLVYGGDTDGLAAMLARLVKCDGFRVNVSFFRGPVGHSWTLNHDAWREPGTIEIRVNLDATEIDLGKLELRLGSGQPDPAFPSRRLDLRCLEE